MAINMRYMLAVVLFPVLLGVWFWRIAVELQDSHDNPIGSVLVMFVGVVIAMFCICLEYRFFVQLGKSLIGLP